MEYKSSKQNVTPQYYGNTDQHTAPHRAAYNSSESVASMRHTIPRKGNLVKPSF